MTSINKENTKQAQFLAVSASIAIHIAIGSFLVLGMFNDQTFTLGLNKSNPLWVSLDSGSGKSINSPQAKKAGRKQMSASTIATTSAANNIPLQNYSEKEDHNGKSLSATGAKSSTNFSDSTAGDSSTFITANPLYRENTPPIYPAIAKLRGYEGIVLVNAEILPNGSVGSTEVSKSSGYTILDKSAMEAVKLWKFEPAKKAGKPFSVRVKLPIKFVLHDDNSAS